MSTLLLEHVIREAAQRAIRVATSNEEPATSTPGGKAAAVIIQAQHIERIAPQLLLDL